MAGIVRLFMHKPPFAAAYAIALACLMISGCAGSQTAAVTAQPAPAEPIEVYAWDRWRIAGQPSPADLDRIAGSGVTLVINLRTQSEIDRLDFDPQAEAVARGMTYVNIPLGGEDGYAPEQVDALAKALDGAQGPVLLHCASGGRARTFWAAYQMKYEDIPLAEATRRMQEVGGEPSALERLVGRRLDCTLGEPLAHDERAPTP